jgi:hypothetical protein
MINKTTLNIMRFGSNSNYYAMKVPPRCQQVLLVWALPSGSKDASKCLLAVLVG